MKLNVAANFIQRVTLLTTEDTIEQQKHQIFQHLRQNNYPSALINRMINRINSKTAHRRSIAHPPTSDATSNDHQSPSSTTNQLATTLQPPPLPPPPTSPPPQRHQVSATLPPPSPPIPRTTAPTPSITVNDLPPDQPTAIASPEDDPHQSLSFTYRSMPHIPMLSRTIANILKKDYKDVRIATRNIITTKSLLRPVKDPVLPQDQHNVIYSIPCNDCNQVYIGMTTNHLRRRVSGHRSDVNKLTNATTDTIQAKTALTQHMINQKHTFNLDQTKILDRTFRSSALPMLEMCHIQNTCNTVNYRTDVDNLNITYAGILHTVKTTCSRRERTDNSDNDNTTTGSLDLDQSDF